MSYGVWIYITGTNYLYDSIYTTHTLVLDVLQNVQVLNIYSHKYESVSALSILRVRIFGILSLGPRKYLGWKQPLDFYLFRCNTCGYFHIDYQHGFDHAATCPFEQVVAFSEISPELGPSAPLNRKTS